MEIGYKIQLVNNKLQLEILPQLESEELLYACYLVKEDGGLEKQFYQEQNKFEFLLEKSGVYWCQYFVKDIGGNITLFKTEKITYVEKATWYILGSKDFSERLVAEVGAAYNIKYLDILEISKQLKYKNLIFDNKKNNIIVFSLYENADNISDNELKEFIAGIEPYAANIKMFFIKSFFEENNKSVVITNKRLEELYFQLSSLGIRCINPHQLLNISEDEYIFENEKVLVKECVRQLEEYSKQDYIKEKHEFSIDTILEDNILKIEFIEKERNVNNQYCYYILKDGKVFYKHHWEKSNHFEYELRENGIYVVQGYIKNEINAIKKSVPHEFFREDFKEKYEAFLSEKDTNEEEEKIPFYHGKYPFSNFFLIVGDEELEDIAIDGFSLQCVKEVGGRENRKTYLFADSELKKYNGGKYLFSGTTVIENELVLGADEINNTITRDELMDNIGCYSLVDIAESDIFIGSDIFAFNRLFYYQDENHFFISNRYHLLLLSMKQCGIKLRPNLEKMLSIFMAVNLQPLLQGMTTEMDVHGVWQLENSLNIMIDKTGVHFVKNKYAELLEEENHLTEPEYRRELELAKNEVLNNIKLVFARKDFKNIIVDLTGGLDSRIIYALIKYIDNSREKVRIYSHKVEGSRDLELAVKINNLCGYKFDDLARYIENKDAYEMDKAHRSFYMGTYFSHGLMLQEEKCADTIQLIGSCGEILLRPYLIRSFIGTNLEDIEKSEEFFKEYFRDLSPYCICDFKYAMGSCIRIMSEELDRQQMGNFEGYDRMYLQFRHGYHFDAGLRNEFCLPNFGPLQSKKLLRLHHLTYNEFRSLKLQYDLTRNIDPILAQIPYDYDIDNKDYDRIKDMLLPISENMTNVDLRDDTSEWDEANRKKCEKTTKILSHQNGKSMNIAELKEKLQNALKRLCKIENGYFGERIGVALFWFVMNHDDVRSIRYLYNKVVSVLDQFNIIEDNQE